MSAFFFFDNLAVTDGERLDEYIRSVRPVVEAFGGRYRVIGGSTTVVEGDWTPRHPVIIEFDNAEKALAWYHSDDYRPLKALRQSAVRCNGVLIDSEG